jgi:DNA repair protein SbcC/Rad50
VAAHSEHDKLDAQVATLAKAVTTAGREHATAATALDAARAEAAGAAERLEEARRAYQDAQTADRASALRVHLHVGQACPVCAQPVATVPEVVESAVAAAEAAGKAARKGADRATAVVAERDAALRELERTLERARAQHDQLTARRAELAEQLAESPGPAALARELDALAALHKRLDKAGVAVRTAREALRRAQAGAEAADKDLSGAWRRFHAARDLVGRLAPPAFDGEDLVGAWDALAAWATAQQQERVGWRAEAVARLEAARGTVETLKKRLTGLFTAANVDVEDVRGEAGAAFSRQAAVAVARAEAALGHVVERREQAELLRAQRADHERHGQVAKALAGHLRANNFERWLLEEALDLLVGGASGILRELSAGQYELVHDKGEFYVVDHHDAGLRRGVRTLSGGETFQASLALALALSEQLAGMSTTAASLESIVLDEGFGTLDAATLDTVAATLENLAARGDRMVGVVTHVPALAERVPVRFEVRKDARTARVERTGL